MFPLYAVVTFLVVAPVETRDMFLELYVPGMAFAPNLTKIVVDEIVPEAPTTIGLEFVPTVVNVELVETSKPTGGVTVIPPIMLVPDTVKDLEVEAEPYVVVIAVSVPEVDIFGLTKVIVEPFLHLTTAVFDVVTGIKYKTSDVFGEIRTDPVKVLELVLV